MFSINILVFKVVSRSEAVIDKVPSLRMNRKLSRIGREFLEEMTLETDCNLVRSSVLDTTNFIYFSVFNKDNKK
jgi:hypothetical protein